MLLCQQSHHRSRISECGRQTSILSCLFSVQRDKRQTLIGLKAFGPEYFFNVAIAAASGSAIVKMSSPARLPNPALLAAFSVESLASSDHIAGSVIQHSIGVFSNVESVISRPNLEETYLYTSRRKSSQTPSASRKAGNFIIP